MLFISFSSKYKFIQLSKFKLSCRRDYFYFFRKFDIAYFMFFFFFFFFKVIMCKYILFIFGSIFIFIIQNDSMQQTFCICILSYILLFEVLWFLCNTETKIRHTYTSNYLQLTYSFHGMSFLNTTTLDFNF